MAPVAHARVRAPLDIRERLELYFNRLWPICRSITGPGYRESLDVLSEIMPTERLEFFTGQKVFDWTVPEEWNVRDAYLVDPNGVKRASFKANNLHLLNYSIPFAGTLTLEELRPHLYSLPEQPDAIPYLTTYYKKRWGFCLTDRELRALPEGNYRVVVDTELKPGRVEVGEAVLPGETEEEILFSTYLCHPSLANNELSGPLVTAFLYEFVARLPRRRYSYRFVVVPETIGSICYLTVRGAHLKRHLVAGYVVTCVGDGGKFTFKKSRRGNSPADRAARVVLRDGGPHEIIDFDPYEGSDERQYCSPGFDLPIGSLMRTRYARYPEYHTSLDNQDFIRFDALAGSVEAYKAVVAALEANVTWLNTVLCGEPQLGPRGLFSNLGGQKTLVARDRAMFWLLNLADGLHDLLSIAERSGQPIEALIAVAAELAAAGLLEVVKNETIGEVAAEDRVAVKNSFASSG
jgi:aminopeptidase-like protein